MSTARSSTLLSLAVTRRLYLTISMRQILFNRASFPSLKAAGWPIVLLIQRLTRESQDRNSIGTLAGGHHGRNEIPLRSVGD